MVIFSLFVQMSEGATYAVVPFVNKKAVGSVAGIVGAGGNAGAVAAGFLFRMENLPTEQGLLYVGLAVALASSAVLLVRFSPEAQAEERRDLEEALLARLKSQPAVTSRPIFDGASGVVVLETQPSPVRMARATAEDLLVVRKYTGLNRFKQEFRDV